MRRNGAATRSILRSAPCFVLASLDKKLCHLLVKCSKSRTPSIEVE
ncbi:hypothetical protein E5E91_03110 [Deinococcus radiodurans R1 = ATCC 13939 = DSM 20539]|nr:hypothetical protein DXG80_12720 [Deinococcus radiodurans]UDK99775.1 hypothetical protein E5E91_03110 [Deinococcus radiodurans R1 = ATCC 13939 = DSM 20539]HCE64334.1 hypothetical protein [Deinococcus radiodurans]